MNFRHLYRSLASFQRCSNSSFPLVIRNYSNSPIVHPAGPKISYVQRMKMLLGVREKTGIDEALMAKSSCLVYLKGDPLLDDDFGIAWMDSSKLGLDLKTFLENSVLLGVDDVGHLQFSLQIANLGKELKQTIVKDTRGNFTDFRMSLMMMPAVDAALASKAKALYTWHRRNTHCASCGTRSERHSTGSSRNCPKCGEVWYPTLSPVGIVLVADKMKSRLLLVRQGRHPKGMFSCIAGFVDLGESLEESIRREVAEEVGLTVLNVQYKASQHWPFPTSNLMIGCTAIVSGDEELDVDREELEDARWFSVDQIRSALALIKTNPLETMSSIKEGTNQFFVPPRGTLAHILIDSWLSDNNLQ